MIYLDLYKFATIAPKDFNHVSDRGGRLSCALKPSQREAQPELPRRRTVAVALMRFGIPSTVMEAVNIKADAVLGYDSVGKLRYSIPQKT